MRPFLILRLLPFVALVASATAQTVAGPQPSASNILMVRCAKCHYGDSAPKGIDLTSYAGAMKMVVPGDADKSKLFLALVGVSGPQMPPFKGLPWAEIWSVRRWILSGASKEGFSERFVMQ